MSLKLSVPTVSLLVLASLLGGVMGHDVQPRNVTASLRVNGMRGRTLREGDRVRLSCSSVAADPPVKDYTWYRNGAEIQRGGSPNLEYPSISYPDFGKYVCQATNEVGSTRSAELTLRGKHKPQGVHIDSRVNGVQVRGAVNNVNMYDRLSLTCASRVSDPPVSRYSWYRNGRVYGSARSLVFDRITPEQEGLYRCAAGNKIGSVSSETITVNVLYAPIDVRVTAPAVAVVGEHITLRCGARGNPVVNRYRWRQLCASQSTHLGAGGAEYTLNATVELSTCDYFCSASNSLGQTESPAQRINVQYAPINVSVVLEAAEVEEGKELTLQCQNTANPPSHRYHWWKDCSGILQDLEGNDSKLVTSFDIADQTCHYYCSATNKIGIQESGAKTVRVLCGVMGHDDCSGCFRMGTGTMVGIVVGALAITALIVLATYFLTKHGIARSQKRETRSKNKSKTKVQTESPYEALRMGDRDVYSELKQTHK